MRNPMFNNYLPKDAKIFVVTLTNANTWYAILTSDQSVGMRGFKIKSRETYDSSGNPTSTIKPFDYAFNSAPDSGDSSGNGFYSVGSGAADEAGVVNGIWARSSVAGTVIECIVYV